jgi:hypothetical protein
MFWICFGYVLDMFWICFGYVLDMFWICFGYVLDMFWEEEQKRKSKRIIRIMRI